jgi:hypothetical protein
VSFRGSRLPARVSETCSREEGLRILTSPRREASLFKLGRNPEFRPFFFLPEAPGVPPGSHSPLFRLPLAILRYICLCFCIAPLTRRIIYRILSRPNSTLDQTRREPGRRTWGSLCARWGYNRARYAVRRKPRPRTGYSKNNKPTSELQPIFEMLDAPLVRHRDLSRKMIGWRVAAKLAWQCERHGVNALSNCAKFAGLTMFVIKLQREKTPLWLGSTQPPQWGGFDQAIRFETRAEARRAATAARISGDWSIAPAPEPPAWRK